MRNKHDEVRESPQRQKTRIPRLRFPEFRDAGSWSIRRVDTLCEVLDYRRKPISEVNRKAGDYPYYGACGIVDYIDDYIYEEPLLLVGEDGARWGAFERTAFIARGKYWVNNHAHVLRPIGASDGYLENYLTFINLGIYITGAAPPKLTLKKLLQIPIPIPTEIAEQQKIADCLSSLDELIAAHAKKLEGLKAYKKGLMQLLFPAEGEKLPRLRFPEFRGGPEWEEKKLGDICETYSGGTPATTNREYYGGTIPFIRSGEIDSDHTEISLTEAGLANSSAKLVSCGDVLIALYGANSGEVALSKIDGAINQAILCLRSNENHRFIFHFLFHMKECIVAKYLQGGQGNLSGEIVKSIIGSFPKTKEQVRIADTFSSLDDLIAGEAGKLEALKTHKNALMQRLFPQAEEE